MVCMKKILFSVLFIFTFLFSFFICADKINIPYFGGINEKVSLDLLFKNESVNNTVLFDKNKPENIIKIDNKHFLYTNNDFKSFRTIKIDDYKNIQKLIIYQGNKIKTFEKTNPDKSLYELDETVNKTLYNRLTIFFLSFFYNPKFYLISYIFLFFWISCIKKPVNNKKYFYLMVFLTVFLRFAQLNNIPFWDDEIYTIKITSIESPLIALFDDLGNPPLYFILFKIFRMFFQNEEFWRVSSVILGSIFNIVFYFYLKKVLNNLTAKIALFIVSVSVVMIYFSQELRCYMLLMLLSVLSSLFLFNFKGKNRIYYLISTIALLYTHFYGAFFVFYNFLFGFFFYLDKKRKFEFLKLNLISFFTFLPILIYKKMALISDFNSWIEKPDWFDFRLVFETFSSKSFLFFVFLIGCFLALKFAKKRKERVFIKYNLFAILFVFILAVIFSYLIKPIFCYRYFYVVYPCYIALISYFLSLDFKFKMQIVLKTIILIVFGLYSRINYQNLFCNHNLYLEFIKNDIDYSMNNYIFMSDTVQGYSGFEDVFKNKKNVKILYLPVNKGIKEIGFDDFNFQKPYSAYVLNLYLKDDVFQNASIIELYKTPLGVYTKSVFKK